MAVLGVGFVSLLCWSHSNYSMYEVHIVGTVLCTHKYIYMVIVVRCVYTFLNSRALQKIIVASEL